MRQIRDRLHEHESPEDDACERGKHLHVHDAQARHGGIPARTVAVGAAFLPPMDPPVLKWLAAVVLIGMYIWYVKAHFEADAEVGARTSLRCASAGSTATHIAGIPPCRACAS